MITPSNNPSAFFREQPSTDVFVDEKRHSVRPLFQQPKYDLEQQAFYRKGFQLLYRLDGALHLPDARAVELEAVPGQRRPGGRASFDVDGQPLQERGYITRGGHIVDASIVQAPVTRHPYAKRKTPSAQRRQDPEGWSTKWLQHTDRDARWTKKDGKSFYGYKVHANADADARWKLIRRIQVTPANVDDGQTLQAVLDTGNTAGRLLADRGYDPQANRALLDRHRLRDGIARHAKPVQEARQRLETRNRAINKTRARVEHVFAELEQFGGKVVRAMTLARNESAITLKCAAYNAKRLVWLVAQGTAT